MVDHQLQDAHEPPCAGIRPEVLFQLGTKRGEAGRELPVPADRLRSIAVSARSQVMEVTERSTAARLQGPLVGRHDLAAGHDYDLVDIALDRHQLECERPWDAVTIAIEGDGSIFSPRRSRGTRRRIKPMVGKPGRGGFFLGEPRLDQEWLARRPVKKPHPRLGSAVGNSSSAHPGPLRAGPGSRSGVAQP